MIKKQMNRLIKYINTSTERSFISGYFFFGAYSVFIYVSKLILPPDINLYVGLLIWVLSFVLSLSIIAGLKALNERKED